MRLQPRPSSTLVDISATHNITAAVSSHSNGILGYVDLAKYFKQKMLTLSPELVNHDFKVKPSVFHEL